MKKIIKFAAVILVMIMVSAPLTAMAQELETIEAPTVTEASFNNAKINEKFYSYKEAKEELEQQEKKPFLFRRKRKIEEGRQKLESIIKEYRSLFEEYLKNNSD